MTSRRAVTPGSTAAIAATAASHCERRSLYADASSLRGEPEWQATSATSSSGSGTDRCSSDRQSSSSARPGSPKTDANWSMIPLLSPM